MWTDALDRDGAPVPVPPEERRNIESGTFIRAVSPKTGRRVVVGPVEGRNRNSRSERLVVGGIDIDRYWDVYLTSSTVVDVPAPIEVSAEGLRDLVHDLQSKFTYQNKPRTVGLVDIVVEVLGFDPTIGAEAASYGGKSAETLYRQHFALTPTKKLLGQLVEDGVLRAVTAGTYRNPSDDPKYVSTSQRRSGWVTSEAYDASVAASDDAAEVARRESLRKKARETVADRHSVEVETEYQRLLGN